MKLPMTPKRVLAWCGGVVAGLLLAACGGGEQVSSFDADRVIAFGDESSLLVDVNRDGNGRKYSINATLTETDPTLNCRNNPLWIQELASSYRLVFPQCNYGPGAVANPTSRIRAALGARIADLAAQIDAQIADGGLRSGDLASVLMGQNDVLALYAQFPTVPEAQLLASADAAGVELGRQVNRLAAADVRVVVSTMINMGDTPFARAEKASHTDLDRAALLSRLSVRINEGMRRTLVNDGRRIGLVLGDELVSVLVDNPGTEDIENVTDPACVLAPTQTLLDCTNMTVAAGNPALEYLWADNLHLGASAHFELGELAVDRAKNNPF